MRVLVINPNTSNVTNERMRAVAESMVAAPDEVEVVSADSGIDFIETLAQSEATVPAVLSLVDARQHEVDGIIIAAFSDPGLSEARLRAACPVFGISESAMTMAARVAERFAIITLGSDLREAIQRNARAYGFAGKLTGVRILPWRVSQVSADPAAHRAAFAEACEQAVIHDRVGAVIIGGGPLSGIADSIAHRLPVPVFDGVRCALQMALGVVSEGSS